MCTHPSSKVYDKDKTKNMWTTFLKSLNYDNNSKNIQRC